MKSENIRKIGNLENFVNIGKTGNMANFDNTKLGNVGKN